MAFSLVIDDTSLVLLLTLVAVLSVSIYVSRSYQPLIHPLILSRQADVSKVRQPKESAIFRNANSPAGFDLALRPRREVNDIADLVKYGATGEELKAKRPIYGVAKTNEDVAGDATAFATGFIKLSSAPVSQTAFAVLAGTDSYESLVALLANAHTTVSSRFNTVVLSPSELAKRLPSSLPTPLSSSGARSVIGIFTTADSISNALQLSFLDSSALIVVPSSDLEAVKKQVDAHFSGSHRMRIYGFDDVLNMGSRGSLMAPETSTREVAQQIQSHFWNGFANEWCPVQHASLNAGVTAQLAMFPADKIPNTSDHIFVEASSHTETPASALMASRGPAGFALALMALYTGTSLTADVLTSSYDDPNPTVSTDFAQARPTLVYASAEGASSLACALTCRTRRSPLASFAAKSKLYSLRNGTFGRSGLIDSLVYAKTREVTGCQRIRNLLIMGRGDTVAQGLLDALRSHLGCAVLNGYLPRLSNAAVVTAPVSATHAFDLQAFAEHEHAGMQVPAHVGPPSVAVEMKVVLTQAAAEKGFTISGNKPDGYQGDPMGEIMVKGNLVAGSTEEWTPTGDFGAYRSNGTLVVLRDADECDPVAVPTLSSRKPVIHQKRSKSSSTGRFAKTVVATALLLSLAAPPVHAAGIYRRKSSSINSTMTDMARMGMLTGQRAAWEQGVGQSALLELDFPGYSVFSSTNGGPPFRAGHERAAQSQPDQVVSMAYHSASRQDSIGRLAFKITGDEVAGAGSALDGASPGSEVLLAAWLNGEIDQTTGKQNSGFYIESAQRALNLVLNQTPRSKNGAISHRYTSVQLWSDAAYMMPPFLAYYGMITKNDTLLQIAYDQLRLYRDAMRMPSGAGQNLWGHILWPNNNTWSDGGLWATGNGWACAGMLRVLATIEQSQAADKMVNQKTDLINWVGEILDAAYPMLDQNALLFHNYMNDTNDFFDTAGTALLTYSTYRFASMVKGANKWVSQADLVYKSLATSLNKIGQFRDGYPVTNVLSFTTEGETSSESLSFLMLMTAAKRDYQNGDVVQISTNSSYASGSSSSAASATGALPTFTSTLALASIWALLLCTTTLL